MQGRKLWLRGVSHGYAVGWYDDFLILAAPVHRVESVKFLHGEEPGLRVVRADARQGNRKELRTGQVVADAEYGDLIWDFNFHRAANLQTLGCTLVRGGHDGRWLWKCFQPRGKGLLVVCVWIEGGGNDTVLGERVAEGAFTFAREELSRVLVDEGERLEFALHQKVFRPDPSDVTVVQPDGGHVAFARGKGGVLDVDKDGRDVGFCERLHRVRRSRHGDDDAVVRAAAPSPEALHREVLGGDEVKSPVQVIGEAIEKSGHVFAPGV